MRYAKFMPIITLIINIAHLRLFVKVCLKFPNRKGVLFIMQSLTLLDALDVTLRINRINDLLATNPNHGQLVSRVNQIIQEAQAIGLMTKNQKKAILQCAVHS